MCGEWIKEGGGGGIELSIGCTFSFRPSSGVKLGHCWTKNSNIGYIISLYKFIFFKMLWITFVQLWGIPELKISAQYDVVYSGDTASRSPKIGSTESWIKTVVAFSGYRWIGWSYYRLCENFWWLMIVSTEQFRPNFCSNLQEFCHFSGTWVLWYLIFQRI